MATKSPMTSSPLKKSSAVEGRNVRNEKSSNTSQPNIQYLNERHNSLSSLRSRSYGLSKFHNSGFWIKQILMIQVMESGNNKRVRKGKYFFRCSGTQIIVYAKFNKILIFNYAFYSSKFAFSTTANMMVAHLK